MILTQLMHHTFFVRRRAPKFTFLKLKWKSVWSDSGFFDLLRRMVFLPLVFGNPNKNGGHWERFEKVLRIIQFFWAPVGRGCFFVGLEQRMVFFLFEVPDFLNLEILKMFHDWSQTLAIWKKHIK